MFVPQLGTRQAGAHRGSPIRITVDSNGLEPVVGSDRISTPARLGKTRGLDVARKQFFHRVHPWVSARAPEGTVERWSLGHLVVEPAANLAFLYECCFSSAGGSAPAILLPARCCPKAGRERIDGRARRPKGRLHEES